jgi:predicted O-methyltransferase YrrM
LYSSFQILKNYLRYYWNASNGKGHGVHSPFVFDFIINVLNAKKNQLGFESIESLRKHLKHNHDSIDVVDFGAGSNGCKSNEKMISDIAKKSLKSPKYARLLYRVAAHYQSKHILELGTSLGLTTAYLSQSGATSVVSFEGSPAIASLARKHFSELQLSNIKIIEGNADHTLSDYLSTKPRIDLAFLDANHRAVPTLDYFNQLLNCAHQDTIFIFDDIHWSEDMELAWKNIQAHDQVTQTIDLFFFGIVLIKKDFKVRQHFSIRY